MIESNEKTCHPLTDALKRIKIDELPILDVRPGTASIGRVDTAGERLLTEGLEITNASEPLIPAEPYKPLTKRGTYNIVFGDADKSVEVNGECVSITEHHVLPLIWDGEMISQCTRISGAVIMTRRISHQGEKPMMCCQIFG